MSNDAARAESYRKILLRVLDDLDDNNPYDGLVRRILATMAHFDDLKGVSDRYIAVKMLPAPIRNAIIENAEREGQAIIAAKAPVISDDEWREIAMRARKKNTRD